MAKMYVANASTQRMLFMYRIPEQPRQRQVPIEPMSQVVLPDDMSPEQIHSVVEQHEPYGFVTADTVRTKHNQTRNIRLCYSLGSPVSAVIINALATKNFTVLDAQGRDMRQQASIASNMAIENALETQRRDMAREGADPGQLKSFETVIQEEEPAGGYGRPDKEVLSEGIKVDKRPSQKRQGRG